MAKNKGEIEEMRLKLVLSFLRDSSYIHQTIGKICSVKLENEYARSGLTSLDEIKNLTSADVEQYCNYINAKKAPSKSKSDVIINGNGVSLKYSSASPSAIVNHTHRKGFEYACCQADVDISELDLMVEKYWELRTSGEISEDTHITDSNCPFNNKEYFYPILKYFLFKGTGSGISSYPADYVLDFPDTTDPNTWRMISQDDIVDKYWNHLVFSIRSKAMPTHFDPNDKNFESIAKWTKYWQNKYRGTLHIRVK